MPLSRWADNAPKVSRPHHDHLGAPDLVMLEFHQGLVGRLQRIGLHFRANPDGPRKPKKSIDVPPGDVGNAFNLFFPPQMISVVEPLQYLLIAGLFADGIDDQSSAGAAKQRGPLPPVAKRVWYR
jgi:hypothetical protein